MSYIARLKNENNDQEGKKKTFKELEHLVLHCLHCFIFLFVPEYYTFPLTVT